MCRHSDIQSEQTVELVAEAVRGRPRVLVLDTRGHVADRLGALGFHVTTFGPGEPTSGVQRLASDVMSLDAEPFDAVVATNMLHGCETLDAMVGRLDELLAPTGRLVVDDFDIAAVDEPTLAWYLAEAEPLVSAKNDLAELVARSRTRHGICHDGEAIEAAIRSRFAVRSVEHVEHLYRELAAALPQTEDGARIAASIRQIERGKIRDGSIRAVGLHIIAERGDRVTTCGARLGDQVSCCLDARHAGLHHWVGPDGKTFDWD